MEHTKVRTDRPPVLAVAAAVLGCVAAATAGVVALFLVGAGGLTEGGAPAVVWLAALSLAAVAQGWGAVHLLRRRGWLLLALASLAGLLPAVALVGVWIEYREGLPMTAAVAAVPLLALCCTLTPAVRRWSTPPAAGQPTTSGV